MHNNIINLKHTLIMTRTEKIEAFLSELKTEIDVLSMVDVDNIESYDDVYYQIEENGGFDEEIIFCHRNGISGRKRPLITGKLFFSR